MTTSRLDIHRVLHILEACGTYGATWPREPGTRGWKLAIRQIYWAFCIFHSSALIVALGLGGYHYRNDPLLILRVFSELTALSEAFMDMIICKIYETPIQTLLVSIRRFVKTATKSEMTVLQKYIDRYAPFYSTITISFSVCATSFALSPVFLKTEFPGDTWYPFSTEPTLVRYLIYASQIQAISTTLVALSVDFKVAMFLWYPTARLEMLMEKLQNITEERHFKSCIRTHQEIIEFVRITEITVRHLIFKTACTMTFAIICGGLPLLHKLPSTVACEFASMVIGGLQRLYITSWPAEDLKQSSLEIAWWAYSTPWTYKSKGMVQNTGIMIMRSQKPLVIGIIFLPPPSLKYYSNFLKTVSSYFMTMRAVVDK